MEFTQIYPEHKPGWHEHDPLEIWFSVRQCIQAVFDACDNEGISLSLSAIGITNQRETTIAWNSESGIPYYNAIVWDDGRTDMLVKKISQEGPDHVSGSYTDRKDRLRDKTGLPLATYFSGSKVRWLIENVTKLREDLVGDQRENVRFGTVDTWLVWQLTGHFAYTQLHSSQSAYDVGSAQSPSNLQYSSSFTKGNVGGLFVTDVTNASRTLFMDINSCQWDSSLVGDVLNITDFPMRTALAKIVPSSHVYGACDADCGITQLNRVPIASILGDQQAALFGQAGYDIGEAKCTYGTGLFLMMNTGPSVVPSTHGLLTTVAYKLGTTGETIYALEGSVAFSGSLIQWLRDQLGIISNAAESEYFAEKVSSNEGLYFVPAFAGLFAPYWRSDARGIIAGMTASHTKHHICRAALEATAYQAKELFDAMYRDSKVQLSQLKVDGGAVANNFLMQFQADMLDAPVIKPVCTETTAMGAAYAAGLAVKVWGSLEEIRLLWASDKVWKNSMKDDERNENFKGWKKAVERSFNWIDEEGTEVELSKKCSDEPIFNTPFKLLAFVSTVGVLSFLFTKRK